MTEHLILMDASGFAFRAYYSCAPRYRHSDGEPTGAIETFLSMTWRMLGAAAADQPTMGVAVFDAPGGNFRHEIFPNYKANRDPARRLELDKQFPIMRAAAEVLGLVPVEKPGFEADDLIATYAHKARAKGIRVTIVSSDKDFGQVVDDGKIEIVDPMLKKRVQAAQVVEKFGVEPGLVPDVQALAGDSVDGIPGMPGCGLDTAGKLVRRFGSLEGVLAHADDVRFPKVRVALQRMMDLRTSADGPAKLLPAAKSSNEARTGADWCRTFLQLTTLRRNVPGRINFEELRLKTPVRSHLIEMLRALEAEGREASIFGLDPQMVRVVKPQKDPLEWWRETVEYGPDGKQLPDDPQPGFYQRRTAKGGPFVPARIWVVPEYDLIEDTPTGRDLVQCELGGRPRDPGAEWPRLSMSPITEKQFKQMMQKYAPGAPPTRATPVDLSTVKSIPNPRTKRRG